MQSIIDNYKNNLSKAQLSALNSEIAGVNAVTMLNDDFTPTYDNAGIEIDTLIWEEIAELNKLGATTQFCCVGHKEAPNVAYIVFVDNTISRKVLPELLDTSFDQFEHNLELEEYPADMFGKDSVIVIRLRVFGPTASYSETALTLGYAKIKIILDKLIELVQCFNQEK